MTTTGLPRIPARAGYVRWWEVRRYFTDAFVISLLERQEGDHSLVSETVLATAQVVMPRDPDPDPEHLQHLAKQRLYRAAERLLAFGLDPAVGSALRALEGSYPPKTWVKPL